MLSFMTRVRDGHVAPWLPIEKCASIHSHDKEKKKKMWRIPSVEMRSGWLAELFLLAS